MNTEKIAAVLAAHRKEMGHRDLRVHCICGWSSGELSTYMQYAAHQTAMLEPVIREAQAEALEEAADAWHALIRESRSMVWNWLYARANGIREGER